MSKINLRAFLPLCMAGASVAALPAAAQTTDQPSAEKFTISPGGVDMRTGRYVFEQTDLSVGEDSETGGLALTRLPTASVLGHKDPFGNLSHNWDIMLIEKNVNLLQNDFNDGSGSDAHVQVVFGARSETFMRQSNQERFEQVSRAGRAQLIYVPAVGSVPGFYTMFAADGTEIVFRPYEGISECSTYKCVYASNINFPDGTQINLAYDTSSNRQLRRITSSKGYAILLEYNASLSPRLVSRACTLNIAIKAAPSSSSCPTNEDALATVNYTYTGYSTPNAPLVPAHRLASFTNAEGATYSYSYALVNGYTEMKFFKPGIATPWLTNTLGITYNPDIEGGEETVKKQVFGDGRKFDYYYNDVPASGNLNSFASGIAGGRYVDSLNNETQVNFGILRKPVPVMPTETPPCREDYIAGSRIETITRSYDAYNDQLGVWVEVVIPVANAIVPIGGTTWTGPGCATSVVSPGIVAGLYFPQLQFGDEIFQVTPGPVEVIDPLGRVWKNHYCDPNTEAGLPANQFHRCLVTTLQWSTDPDGKRTEYWIPWSTRNVHKVTEKAKSGSGLPDTVTSATYDCTKPVLCAKPTSKTDAKGNVTNYVYDQTHGGLLKETAPAVGGVSPEKRYEYVSRKAWVRNADNTGYAQSTNDHVLLSKEEYCITSAAVNGDCAAGPSDEVVTVYEYGPSSGPNNLLLRGIAVTAQNAEGQMETLRTCYGYDNFGRRISETKPLANLAICP